MINRTVYKLKTNLQGVFLETVIWMKPQTEQIEPDLEQSCYCYIIFLTEIFFKTI